MAIEFNEKNLRAMRGVQLEVEKALKLCNDRDQVEAAIAAFACIRAARVLLDKYKNPKVHKMLVDTSCMFLEHAGVDGGSLIAQ